MCYMRQIKWKEVAWRNFGTLHGLERDEWSMIKCLSQASKKYAPLPLASRLDSFPYLVLFPLHDI